MPRPWPRLPVLAAALALVAGGTASIVRAGDPPAAKPAEPDGPKAIQSAFLKGLVGSWVTEMTEGESGRHKGTSTWRLLMKDTALVEDYSGSLTLADGKTVPWTVHVVVREGADGKTVEAWVFDNLNVPPLRLSGPLTEAGFDVRGETPDGPMRVACEKQGAERLFHLWLGEELLLTDAYRPAPK